jgi:hypothetical protein
MERRGTRSEEQRSAAAFAGRAGDGGNRAIRSTAAPEGAAGRPVGRGEDIGGDGYIGTSAADVEAGLDRIKGAAGLSAIQTEIPAIKAPAEKSPFLKWILLALALAPILYMAWLIAETAVNILYVDEWGYIVLFEHLAQHTLTLQDLLAQHNESRPFLPVLIILSVGKLTHWDVRYDMWLEFAFACIVSLNIFLLSRRLMRMTLTRCLFLWVLTNMLLFSAEQSQNWTFGIQMIFFMPMMIISGGMLVAYSQMNVMLKFALAILLATAATFSHAIGQIAWIILLPPLFVGSRAQNWRAWPNMLAWLIAWAANMWIYYRDYYKPPWHPSMLLALKYPGRAIEYFTAYLGVALAQGYHRIWVSIAFGFALLGLVLVSAVHLWRVREQPGVLESMTAWLMLCVFSLASACMATVGRLGFGVIQSQESRYTGFSIYLVIGLVYLGSMIVRDVYRRGEIVSAQVRGLLGLGFIIIPHITTEIGGYRQMWADRHVRLAGKAFTQLLNIFPSPQGVFMTTNVLPEKDFLDQQGILSPGLVKSSDLSLIAGPKSGEAFGKMDVLKPVSGGVWHAQGWGIVPDRHDPAEVVLLAGEDGTGRATAFAETLAGGNRPDVAKLRHRQAYQSSGWGIAFRPSAVPTGTKTISAWVYDPETGRAFRMGGAKPFIRP